MTRTIPIKFLLAERDSRGHVDESVLSVYRELGVVPKEGRDDNFNRTPDDLSNYKLVLPGDVVVNKMKAWQGSLGVSPYRGIVSGDYLVCRVVSDVDPRYLHHILRSRALVSEYAARSKGIRPGQWRLYWDDLGDIRLPVPSVDDQRAAGERLDSEDQRLADLIEARRRMRLLLEERRNSVVNEMTTPPRADHPRWRRFRLKHLVTINDRGLGENTDPDHSFRYLDISAVGRGKLADEPATMTFGNAPSRARRLVQNGDVIVSTVRTYLRAVWPVEGDCGDLVVSTGFAVLHPQEGVHPPYLAWLIQSDSVIEEVVRRSVGISYPAIGPSEIGEIPVWLPDVEVQRSIAAELASEVQRIEALISRQGEMVALLTERRHALASAYVVDAIGASA